MSNLLILLIFGVFQGMGATVAPTPSPTSAPSPIEEGTEKDFHLRSVSGLQILNHYGSIEVQGWPLDKVRVQIKKSVGATEAALLPNLGVEVDQNHNRFEIHTTVGKNLFLTEKIKNRRAADLKIDLIIKAPGHVPLTVLGKKSKIAVKSWSASVDITSQEGSIRVEDSSPSLLRVGCPKCAMSLENIHGKIKVTGGEGAVDIKKIVSPDLFIETTIGALSFDQVQGPQMYISDSGDIHGKKTEGVVSFKTRSGDLSLTDVLGAIQGVSKTGDMHIEIKSWKASEKQMIEAEDGSIHLALPPSFSGEVEATSETGKLYVDFPLEKIEKKKSYGPEPANRIRGRAGDGGEILSVTTKKGNVWILQAL